MNQEAKDALHLRRKILIVEHIRIYNLIYSQNTVRIQEDFYQRFYTGRFLHSIRPYWPHGVYPEPVEGAEMTESGLGATVWGEWPMWATNAYRVENDLLKRVCE